MLPIAMPPVMEPLDTGIRASIMQEPCNVDRFASTACGHCHGKEAARSQGRLGRRRRRNTGEHEEVPRPHDPARRVIAPDASK